MWCRWWVGDDLERFADAPDHDRTPEADGEHHGDPRVKAELGFGVLAADPDLPVARKRHEQPEHQQDAAERHEPPPEVVEHEIVGPVQRTAQHGRFYDSDDDEGDQRGDRDEKQPRLGPARVVETEDVPEPHRAGSPDSVGVVSEPIRQYITVEKPSDSALYIRSESRNYCGVVHERCLSKRLP